MSVSGQLSLLLTFTFSSVQRRDFRGGNLANYISKSAFM